MEMTHEMRCHTINDPEVARSFEEDASRGGGCKYKWDYGLHSDEQEAIEWTGWRLVAGMLRDW